LAWEKEMPSMHIKQLESRSICATNKKNKYADRKWSFCSVHLHIGATKALFLQNEYTNASF
jgi:hypothetical protein